EVSALREGQASRASLEIRSVETLSRAELQEAAALLALSFDETSLFCMAFPKPAARRRILQGMFAAVLKDAVRFGRVEIAQSSQIVGIVIWYLPGGYPISMLRILRLLPDYLRMVVASPLGVLRLFRAERVLERLRPKAPHCHGQLLCARPGSRV